MDRTQILDLMSSLKLYGMHSAYDEVMAIGLKHQHEPLRKIVARLNAEGIPGPHGGLWNASTIDGSWQRRNGILNNEPYLARLVWNRQRFLKNPETSKRVSQANPRS
ncbi:recombinase family protein [Rubellimicrobium arenae]|uniref:recombinase family protein n=1 Tax=Rubellimicrobium arenae TaxID=2817372 RepID=UPI001B3072A4|nr:recombinase family protein [Rubellimicrobium arenae]